MAMTSIIAIVALKYRFHFKKNDLHIVKWAVSIIHIDRQLTANEAQRNEPAQPARTHVLNPSSNNLL